MPYSPLSPQYYEQAARIQVQEQERKRDKNLLRGKQLSRRASVLLLLCVLASIIAIAAIGYHFL